MPVASLLLACLPGRWQLPAHTAAGSWTWPAGCCCCCRGCCRPRGPFACPVCLRRGNALLETLPDWMPSSMPALSSLDVSFCFRLDLRTVTGLTQVGVSNVCERRAICAVAWRLCCSIRPRCWPSGTWPAAVPCAPGAHPCCTALFYFFPAFLLHLLYFPRLPPSLLACLQLRTLAAQAMDLIEPGILPQQLVTQVGGWSRGGG